jgi:hypothetical protein
MQLYRSSGCMVAATATTSRTGVCT